jgi:hypothetical protein
VWSALCAKIAEQPVSTSPGTLPGPTKETFNASRADVECRSVMERISVASATPTTSPDAQAGGLPFMVLHTRELA